MKLNKLNFLMSGVLLASWGVSVGAAPIDEHQYNYNTEASIREIMAAMVEWPAEALWDPSNGEWTDEGMPDIPDDESNWNRLRYNALILREGANAMNLPGRVVDHGEGLEGEYSPAEIENLIKTQYAQWSAFSKAMEGLADQFIEAIDNKDKDKVIELGNGMDSFCTACHTNFWYKTEY